MQNNFQYALYWPSAKCKHYKDTDALINIIHLSHCYARSSIKALDDITLNIPAGSCLGLLGPNGAGKTTLLSILTGLLVPQTGTVEIKGLNISRNASEIKAISAYVPQDYAFYPALTGRENLQFFADIYGVSNYKWRKQLEYCTHICRLNDLLDRRVSHYSGGMKRRLNLAIGLLNSPRILYLDEPTVGIDAESRQMIIDGIQALRSEGTTIIYTSHYMEEVETICDEIAIINHGHLVARDTTINLTQQGQQKTLVLTVENTPTSSNLQALQPWSPRIIHERQLELSLCDSMELAKIFTICHQHQLQLQQAQFGISKLERTYLSLLESQRSEHPA